MLDNLNELIEINLKLLYESPDKAIWKTELIDKNGDEVDDHNRFAKILEEKGLVNIDKVNGFLCNLTEFGNTVFINGGWIKYLENKSESFKQLKEKEDLELELAKSNLKSNELNREISERNAKNEKSNRISTWVNVIIGILNFSALIWQIIKSGK